MPKYSPALRKAVWPVSGRILIKALVNRPDCCQIMTYISGSVTPLSAYALFLALRQAIRMDSVPPLVVTPADPPGALNIVKTIDTISASIFLTPGKTSG